MKKLQSESGNILVSAFKMAMGTLGSRVLGLVRDILMAASFSIMITDAWLVAYRIPNLFRRLFGEGALSVSFIPLLIEARKRGGAEEESRLIRGVFSLLFMVLGVSSLACILFAPQIIGFIGGGEAFKNIAGKTVFAIKFLRIMSFFMLFICLFAFFMAILNSRKKFFAAAFAPMILNVTLIIACLLPQKSLPIPGEWLAWMALLGGFLQMLLLVPSVIKQKLLPSFTFKVFTPEVKQVLKNTSPALLSMGILQVMTMVNVYYASQLENGANSWIYYADRLLELPLSLIAVSFATALLPSLSEKWSENNLGAFGKIFQSQLQFTLFLAIPAGIGLFMLALPIIELVFERGLFTNSSSVKTASILQVYAFSLVVYASIRIVNVSFYAAKMVWLPAVGAAVGLAMHVLTVSYWMESFGIAGLAISTSLAGFVNLVFGAVFYYRKFGGFSIGSFVRSCMKYIIAGLCMASFLPLYQRLLEVNQWQGAYRAIWLGVCIVTASLIYFLVCGVLKTDELGRLKSRFFPTQKR